MAKERNRDAAFDAAPAADAVVTPPPVVIEVAPPAAAGAELLTPEQWGERKGNVVVTTPERPWVEPHSKNFHDEAATLHGWKSHAYDEQNPTKAFHLSEADYDAALAAAAEFPACPAHAAALPPGVKAPPLPKHIEEALAAQAKAKAEGSKPSGA